LQNTEPVNCRIRNNIDVARIIFDDNDGPGQQGVLCRRDRIGKVSIDFHGEASEGGRMKQFYYPISHMQVLKEVVLRFPSKRH
jgi:hypothetical protein